jgi:hypothetical protein
MAIGKDGTSPPDEMTPAASLAEGLIPQTLTNAAATFVDSLKINSVSEEIRRGRPVVIKRRNIYSEQLTDLANLYFRISGIPIRFWSKAEDWRRWEVKCFRMLNGDRFRAYSSGTRTVCADKLPGKSLWEHLNSGTLTRQMMQAAGREFTRAHQFWSEEFRGLWSHGDAGMPNVVYDQETDRARLIDFEIVHDKSLAAKSRHADDLLVFLLDLLAVAPNPQWLALALPFLNAYGNASAVAELKNQLGLPSGLAWIWWGVRTSFAANPAKLKGRLAKLRDLTANLRCYRAFAAKRARKSRRASITCQQMSAGIPRPISRARETRESAKAPSPGIPSRLPTTK